MCLVAAWLIWEHRGRRDRLVVSVWSAKFELEELRLVAPRLVAAAL